MAFLTQRFSALFALLIGSQTITPVGIASAAAVGRPIIDGAAGSEQAVGITSAAAVGTPTINQVVNPAGIASAGAVGTPKSLVTIAPAGIATAGALGVPFVGALRVMAGIASAEAFGTPTINQAAPVVGIAPPALQVGRPTVEWLPVGGLSQAAYARATHFLTPAAAREDANLTDVVRLRARFYSTTRQLVSPTTVTLTVIFHDGSSINLSPAAVSAGLFQADHTIARAGWHEVRWAGTGAIVAEAADRFHALP